MGWVFIGMGAVLGAIGVFLGFYGLQLLSEKPSPPSPVVERLHISLPEKGTRLHVAT